MRVRERGQSSRMQRSNLMSIPHYMLKATTPSPATTKHSQRRLILCLAFPGVYSTIVLFGPLVGRIDAVRFPKTFEVVVLSTVCVWPAIVPLMSVTISVEISVVVLILWGVGARVRVNVVVECAVTSVEAPKSPAQVARFIS
jgi:hypothetical protein